MSGALKLVFLWNACSLLILSALNPAFCQRADTVRLGSAIFLESGTVVTPGSDKGGSLGNFIMGFGYEKEIAAGRIGNNAVSMLIKGGFGVRYYLDIQCGVQFETLSNIYLYWGIQYMMYYWLGSTRALRYSNDGGLRHWPDVIVTQFLPNFGLNYNAGKYKIELLSSTVNVASRDIWYYFVFRIYFIL